MKASKQARTGLFEQFRTYEQWTEALGSTDKYHRRWRFEQALPDLDPSDLWNAWCGLCKRPVVFRLPSVEAGVPTNLREELVCEACGMNARVRAALQVAAGDAELPSSKLYITEQGSPTYAWLKRNIPGVVGSEFVADPNARKAMDRYLQDLGLQERMRFEDVTNLSFGSASLDVIASFDVLEHVPNYQHALSEFARALKPGGILVLTAPFIAACAQTVVRATVDADGVIEHLQPPEYHGDPAADTGILCYYHFGWDLLDEARAAGFSDASMALPWNPGLGLMGSLWTLAAVR